MKPLVVPVNFSPSSSCAARYAADLGEALQVEVHLIHVIDTTYTSTDMAMTQELYNTMVDSAKDLLKKMQADLVQRTHNKITVHTLVEVGTIFGQIKEHCDRLQPIAVILGATGPTWEKFLIGSPVGSLLRLPYPVLVVPENTSFQKFRHIALACDGNDLDSGLLHSIGLLKEFRQRFRAQIDIITVGDWKTWKGESFHLLSQAWKARLKDLDPEIHQIQESRVEEGLLGYLAEHPADLVVVFPKKHRIAEFHTSQSRKFAKHSDIPVLSLHES